MSVTIFNLRKYYTQHDKNIYGPSNSAKSALNTAFARAVAVLDRRLTW